MVAEETTADGAASPAGCVRHAYQNWRRLCKNSCRSYRIFFSGLPAACFILILIVSPLSLVAILTIVFWLLLCYLAFAYQRLTNNLLHVRYGSKVDTCCFWFCAVTLAMSVLLYLVLVRFTASMNVDLNSNSWDEIFAGYASIWVFSFWVVALVEIGFAILAPLVWMLVTKFSIKYRVDIEQAAPPATERPSLARPCESTRSRVVLGRLVTNWILGVLFTIIAHLEAYAKPTLVEIQLQVVVPSGNSMLSSPPIKMMVMADVHLGPYVSKADLEEVTQGGNNVIQEADPDMIFFVGDLTDGYVRADKQPYQNGTSASQELSGMSSTILEQLGTNSWFPRYGKYFVTGNHEYIFDPALSWTKFLGERAGFIVLQEEKTSVSAVRLPLASDFVLYVRGVADYGLDDVHSMKNAFAEDYERDYFDLLAQKGSSFGTGADSPSAPAEENTNSTSVEVAKMDSSQSASYTVLLCHQPQKKSIDFWRTYQADASDKRYASQRVPGVMVSGHTHGGEFWPFSLAHEIIWSGYFAGYFPFINKHESSSHGAGNERDFYVSDGVFGWGPRVRLNSRNEITLFRLEFVSERSTETLEKQQNNRKGENMFAIILMIVLFFWMIFQAIIRVKTGCTGQHVQEKSQTNYGIFFLWATLWDKVVE